MMDKQTLAFRSINTVKAEFDAIYAQPDPRGYYNVLYGLNYVIPDVAKGAFRKLAGALASVRNKSNLTILDIGCSYGINAALIKTPLDMERLAHRYHDLSRNGAASGDVMRMDRHYFASWPRESGHRVIGLDVSRPAIDYAREVGLLDGGIVRDLEQDDLDAGERKMLRDVDLVITTGCVGYVGRRTFERVLEAVQGPRPWVANFVLRMFPFTPIADALTGYGLATEKLQGVTFAQRRFHSADEQQGVLAALAKLGVEADDKEEAGAYHAELYLSRPPSDQVALPLADVISVSSGIDGAPYAWQR